MTNGARSAKGRQPTWIDPFRLVAAVLVVAVHTYPFETISPELNLMVIHVFARIAVPFFLMATGYFLLPRYLMKKDADTAPLFGFIKKTAVIYALASVLYLPISIYAGHYAGGRVFTTLIRNIVFDGMFYHLWYLPAVIIGVLIVYFAGRKFPIRGVFYMALALYFYGLFGDSYYGLISGMPFVGRVYSFGFHLYSFTRNGLFYAPIFLVMGAGIAVIKPRTNVRANVIRLVISLAFMLFEGYVLHHHGFPRHSSMYIALLPSMYFLFCLIVNIRGRSSAFLRSFSMWIFIIHPLFIIAVRGAARVLGLTALLVQNTMVHFIAVAITSAVFSAMCAWYFVRRRERLRG